MKDRIEEALFERRRDLFTAVDLVFFDTTSIYFEGHGGQTLGRYGHSKDHRPDLRQMIVGMALDSAGWPLCCELWPGNTTDVKTLLPVVKRLQHRFRVRRAPLPVAQPVHRLSVHGHPRDRCGGSTHHPGSVTCHRAVLAQPSIAFVTA